MDERDRPFYYGIMETGGIANRTEATMNTCLVRPDGLEQCQPTTNVVTGKVPRTLSTVIKIEIRSTLSWFNLVVRCSIGVRPARRPSIAARRVE